MKPKKESSRKRTAASGRSPRPVSEAPATAAEPGSSIAEGAPVRRRRTATRKPKAPDVVPTEFAAEVTATAEPTSSIAAPMPVSSPPQLAPPVPEGPTDQPEAAGSAPKRILKIPPILLEGDKPSAATHGGPGQRYALGPTPPAERLEAEGELPEAYGTRQLLLAARDPHWLYAHWDLTLDQQRHFNSLSKHRHLVLRIYAEATNGSPETEVHVHPESRHWFIHVRRAGTKYSAVLGYYPIEGDWVTISTSGVTLTPTETTSSDATVEFATIPYELPMANLVGLVKDALQENVPLAQALRELRAAGHPGLPKSAPLPGEWTAAQERALAEVLSMDQVRRVWMGSLEITELIRRQAMQELASQAAAQLGAPTSPGGPGSISSPFGAAPSAKGFWFNINAELIIYGATEPGATVTIGRRTIQLRPDGSFSYRFALPDGEFELPVVAVSADQTDGRAAELTFSRNTQYRGDVGAHPQDPALPKLSKDQF